MKYAAFWGCKIPYYLEQYKTSTEAVLGNLGIDLVETEFNCCGYPVRNLRFDAYILSAAKNLAIALKQGSGILTPCKCCYGSLKHAEHYLKEDHQLRQEVNDSLEEEGLHWEEGVKINHLLPFLANDLGVDAVKGEIKTPCHGLNIAAHYGCHALRPGSVTGFDDPLDPTIFESLVNVTGAKSIKWGKRLDCCGNPLWEKNKDLSLSLMNKKLSNAEESGADYLCTACTYCQLQFDTVRNEVAGKDMKMNELPSILYPQLLGLSMGLQENVLGLEKNRSSLGNIRWHFRQ